MTVLEMMIECNNTFDCDECKVHPVECSEFCNKVKAIRTPDDLLQILMKEKEENKNGN